MAGLVVALSGFALSETGDAPANAGSVPTLPAAAQTEAAAEPPVLAYIGDSYTTGSTMNTEGKTWTALLNADLNATAQSLAVGSNGYVTGDDNFVVQSEQVRPDADVVVLFGSRNDSQGYDAVNAAATTALANVRSRAADADVIVIAPAWVNTNPPASVREGRDALRDAAEAASVRFVDALDERWLAAGDGLIGADGVHPTDLGHAELLQRIRPLIDEALAS